MSITCQHEEFRTKGNVYRLSDVEGGPITGYSVEFIVHCAKCNLQFRFRGKDYGSSPHQPMLSADGLELRAPIEPAHVNEICGQPLKAGNA